LSDHAASLPLKSPAAAVACKQPAKTVPAAIAQQPAQAEPAAIALPSKQPAHLRKSRRHCRNNRPRKSPNTALANPDTNENNSTRTETISLTVTQLRRKIKDLQKLKDRHLDQVSDLKSMNKQLQTDLHDKSEEVSTALKEKKENFLKIQSDMNEKQAEYLEMLNGKDARINAMAQLHLVEISAKSAEVRKLTFKFNADRKTANTVSYFVFGT
jgi:predicted RNase H-like nuclease (RuvC/YqgF family)